MAVGLVLLMPWLGDLLFAIEGYWSRSFVETYRGYDIYYFLVINVYGVIPEGQNPDPADPDSGWRFAADLEAARRLIDSLVDEPVFIESYGEWDIYREPGFNRYYGVQRETGEETSRWSRLEDLKRYIDGPGGRWQLMLPGRVIEVGLEEDLLILRADRLTFDYLTDKPDPVKRVWVVLKTAGGDLIEVLDLDGPHELRGLEGWYAYWGSLSLPGPGGYLIEGYVDTYLRELQMVELRVKVPSHWDEAWWWLEANPWPGITLSAAGAILTYWGRRRR
jgi:hypothetical protein